MYRRIQNSNIPYTSITKETWLSLVKTLEMDQIGQIITAMYDYIYTGKEPSFNSKVMNGQWDMLIENVERMSKGYFSKADNGVASAKKRLENKKKNQTQPETNNSMESNNDFKVEPAIEYRGLSHVNPNIIPQEEFISDEQKYGPDVMDLIEDNPEIITALKSVVEYNSGDIDKEYQAKMANTKIDQIVRSKNNDKDFIRRVENFCADFIREYTEHILNNNNNDLKEF